MRSELVLDQTPVAHFSYIHQRSISLSGWVVTWRRVVCKRVGLGLLHRQMAIVVAIMLRVFVHHKIGPLLGELTRGGHVGVDRVDQGWRARDWLHAELPSVVG